MIEKTVTIGTAFETRSAALLVQTAGKFDSNILIKIDERMANAKSIMGIIALGASQGQTVQLMINGPDETLAMAALEQFFSA